MNNMQKRLVILAQLKNDSEFYRLSLQRVSVNCTEENYQCFLADAKVMHDHEKQLYDLEAKA